VNKAYLKKINPVDYQASLKFRAVNAASALIYRMLPIVRYHFKPGGALSGLPLPIGKVQHLRNSVSNVIS
jgi:hypothetical protein